ncbi:secretion protein HlyD [Luminiphilus syltensis NOR5-1B]|uniref:Secretion protein HlyD n=1 Tax=Luminiphilus syltensis NOR5-1B TaxID=565045 RepID=B8KS98_9GAMM|nr:HlyD family secretion protein [Luminiphilus syltensis]EED36119.1 secretion protein HlyD [Luminiphilus syltensis NOR5-1B]
MDDTSKADDQVSTPSAGADAEKSFNKGMGLVLAILVLTLVWYLAADRMTPSTSQARVNGYVVGVAPRVSGPIVRVLTQNNARVEVGQSLFEIDASDYQIALAASQSQYEQALNQVGAGDANVDAARANLTAAIAGKKKAAQDYQRLTRLYAQDPGAVSQRRVESSEANLEAAEAKVLAASAQVQSAIDQKGGDDDDSNAILMSARAAVEKAEFDLENTVVKASKSGTITDLRAETGQFAQAGAAVMTLVSAEDFWIDAEFTENNLGNMGADTAVEIVFDVLPGQVFSGQVASIGLGISAASPPPPGALPTISNNRDWLRQAQRFPVQIRFDVNQQPELREQIRIGGQAFVIAYNDAPAPLRWLGKLYIRIASIFSYAY